ncbi:MAG: ABC transporter ATP-binding protein [Candidatus Anstonellaceae archaeon]
MAQKVLEIKNVSFTYEGKENPALSNISLSFFQGEFVGIIGPVGSGKTSLLYCCNGLIPKEIKGKFSGSVTIFGKDISTLSFKQIAKFSSMVFQDADDQIFNLTVVDEVAFGLVCTEEICQKEARKKAMDALKKVGLENLADADPTELSAGQKQKVALACAIAQGSPILLLDEPVASLDWKSACEIYSILSKMASEDKTIIITEQDTCLLAKHATQIVVLAEGKLVAQGKPSLLFSRKIQKLGLRVPVR